MVATSVLRRLFLLATVALIPIPAAAATPVCDAAAFACPASGTCVINHTWTVGSGCTLDFGTRALEIRGKLRAELPGGEFTVSAGDLTLVGGKLEARGTRDESGGFIGLMLTGAFAMRGTGPRVDTSAQSGGGVIQINAASADLSSGSILARGGAGEECGEGGEIDVETHGPITSNTILRADTPGSSCGGGTIDVIGSAVTVARNVDVRGGASGGDDGITLWSQEGDVVVAPTARLRADGTGQDGGAGADGGTVFLASARDIFVGAAISAKGHPPHAVGGGVFLQAEGKIVIGAPISAVGFGLGSGGDVLANAGGDITAEKDISAGIGFQNPTAQAGTIQIRSSGRLKVRGKWDISGPQSGQMYLIGNPLILTGQLVARGDTLGLIDIQGCRANIKGKIDTRGSMEEPFPFGIRITSGVVNIGPQAQLLATPCRTNECLQLATRPGSLSIAAGAVIEPTPSISEDPTLPGC